MTISKKNSELIERFKEYEYNKGIFNNDDLEYEILKIYYDFKLTNDMNEQERKSQDSRRKAHLTALKKRIKREIVSKIVIDLVKYYNIEKTTFHFFSHICTEILERNVDNRYILNNFSNMILDEKKELKKLSESRNASNKMSLENSYNELVLMSHIKEKSFRKVNFKIAYLNCYAYANTFFSNEKVFAIPQYYEVLDRLYEEARVKKEERDLSKIMVEQVEEEQKIQQPKKRRL
ncbi:hypothetical protein [Klebsiella pneumoniae]|uniref:hypothetical protein n=2 Tax=Klebsiella pneumoniae TaxID=573 RepID=UPI0009BA8A0C|nr:hypothetical protein [Klebsiella pneumoniae]SLR51923.1 Uncharacterised protein [Klebsiella pneumoniae]SLR51946.1 Uncharacterised protein [Klebsiella pneumoniae]SLR72277.1 Uncharacterised protein [Klebsiella pneumoniae]SLR72301.1 Uncharacterised protein [Klebsiella pneumoniae]SLR77600.1 Uncharacterised protein [Klebsiella pneumoniae]